MGLKQGLAGRFRSQWPSPLPQHAGEETAYVGAIKDWICSFISSEGRSILLKKWGGENSFQTATWPDAGMGAVSVMG